MIFNDILNWLAFAWFMTCWVGYTFYARKAAEDKACLAALIYSYRIDWIKGLLRHDNRISDLALLGNLMQMVNFMATTNIFVLAGAVTVLYSSESVLNLLEGHTFVTHTTLEQVQFKLLVLVLIFVYAFFRFTWALRQHTFCSIMIGAAPHVPAGRSLTVDEEQFCVQVAKISDRAAHEFNFGLRSYYFALSLLAWFISPLLFIPACTIVVVVLYLREFRSRTLSLLVRSRQSFIKVVRANQEQTTVVAPPQPDPTAPVLSSKEQTA
jgi:uncharacterized membrane protein